MAPPMQVEMLELFDVHPETGFMPPRPPLDHLPAIWAPWEKLLAAAREQGLQPGDKLGLTKAEKARSEFWRACVRKLPQLPVDDLATSPILLRRARLVLIYLMHFYIHTLPPDAPVVIPRPISIPLLRVAKILDLPPVITFSDTVLYNWTLNSSIPPNSFPKPSDVRSQTLFSDLRDEEEFYLCSARIEIRGADALAIMRSSMDEIFVGDAIAVNRLTTYLHNLTAVINDLKALLLDVRNGCDPEVYYKDVRPWFRGEDSDPAKRKWVFEGSGDYADLNMLPPDRELSGASAGQSSLVHALDIFLGVDHERPNMLSFMTRMQRYMPRQHRLFLDHFAGNPRPLRAFVLSAKDEKGLLKEAYNGAVMALKEFRDAHMIIATLYVIGPARRAALEVVQSSPGSGVDSDVVAAAVASSDRPKGTGGTDLVRFLKGVRNDTSRTVLSDPLQSRRQVEGQKV